VKEEKYVLDYAKWVNAKDANWYSDDPILTRYARRYLSENMLNYVEPALDKAGQLIAEAVDERAAYTDRDGSPKLIRYDKTGQEINEVWHNEGYLQTIRDVYGTGVVAFRYDEQAPEKVPFFVNSILLYLICEAEIGIACPVGLTQSTAFVLEKFGSEEQKAAYLTRLASLDPEEFAQGATFLTEINGGSDVGSIETVARKVGDHYLLTGEKWFASNCDAEIAIALARVNDKPSTKGLGIFLVPRTLPSGERNQITIRRLKDKLGSRAVPTGELVLNEAVGYLIGDENLGFKYMAEALNMSRLDTALCGLAFARRAFLEGVLYCRQRVTFGQTVIHYPMVQETLIDIMTEIEAGFALSASMIRLFDSVHTYNTAGESDTALLRMLLSLAKYRLSELGVTATKRVMELHGGNGYIEEYPIPRLMRDALVNPIWEGPANIQSLEVLKGLQRNGSAVFLHALRQTLDSVKSERLQKRKAELQLKTDHLETAFAHVLGQNPVRQSALAKKLADMMYDLFAAVSLLEEAAYDLEKGDGDGRRAVILEHWMGKVLTPEPDYGLFSQHELSAELFDTLITFKKVILQKEAVESSL
jgi:acyl-CoA dehydrogenase